MDKDEAWYRACREIIDRCVAPDMYGNAMALLDRAMAAATNSETVVEDSPQRIINAAFRRLGRK